MTMTTTARLHAMIERDQAARAVDPALLSEGEKNAKILALQARVTEMESIATFLMHQLQAVERATLDAGAEDRSYRRLILDLCHRRWECAMPVTLVEPETGAESFMRRAL